jgi:hypothetical protein
MISVRVCLSTTFIPVGRGSQEDQAFAGRDRARI